MDERARQPARFSPRGKAALFLAAFLFFLLTGSRERPFSDALPIWEVAESIVRRASVSIRTSWPADLPRGPDGRVYAVAPLMQSLVHVPGAWGRWALGKIAPASAPHTVPFFSHLAPAALGGLTCLAFFLLAGRLVSAPAAAIATGILALGTSVWVYARSPYSEILQTACFLLFLLALQRARERPDRRSALWLGAAAGALVASKLVYLLAILGGAVWLAWRLLRRGVAAPGGQAHTRLSPAELLRLFAWTAATLLPFAVMVLLHNQVRWGSPFASGYALQPTPGVARVAPFGENIAIGLWGLFLSPGKSFFLYSPPALLGLLGLPRLSRRSPEVVGALALTALPVVLIYARFLFWAGDYAWGPRYLVFLAPLFLLPAAVLLADLLVWMRAPGARPFSAAARWGRRATLAAATVLVVGGVVVQVLGNAFIWDHHIRITREAGDAWLGSANRAGAAVPEREGLCGACFEDMHRQQWLPPFQPIDGHRWLLGHVLRGHDWQTAEKDAAWKRYTTLTLDISHAYNDVRLDWWFLELRKVNAPVAIALLLVLAAGMSWAGWRFVREVRRTAGG
jgi:hypothetical protein